MIEYKVRPVTRWIVTYYQEHADGMTSGGQVGEFLGRESANDVAKAMAAKDDGKFADVDERDLADIPLLLRRIAEQIDNGELRANVGLLSLRATGQRRPTVFGFGKKVDGVSECGRAAEEILRLQGVPPASKDQVNQAIKALNAIVGK